MQKKLPSTELVVTTQSVEITDTVQVFEKNGAFWVDSRDVAKHFRKRHKDVLKRIAKLTDQLLLDLA